MTPLGASAVSEEVIDDDPPDRREGCRSGCVGYCRVESLLLGR